MSTYMISEWHSSKTIKKQALSYTVSKNVSNVSITIWYLYLSLTQVSLPIKNIKDHTPIIMFITSWILVICNTCDI